MTESNVSANAEELEIINPDLEIKIKGEVVVIRELNFLQGLSLHAQIVPITQALGDLLMGDDISIDALYGVFSAHQDTMVLLVGESIKKPPAWVLGLSDEDGLNLLMAFWNVNKSFFLRRAMMNARQIAIKQKMASHTASSSAD